MGQAANTIALCSELEDGVVKRPRPCGSKMRPPRFPTAWSSDVGALVPQCCASTVWRVGASCGGGTTTSPSVVVRRPGSLAPSRADVRRGRVNDVGGGRNQESGVCHRCIELGCEHRKN